tara:strand:+ start:220 stop:348 length:129 start_codon:yes stop_codon:yes gene_type:complete
MNDYIENLIDNYYKDASLVGTLPNEFDYLRDKDVIKIEQDND